MQSGVWSELAQRVRPLPADALEGTEPQQLLISAGVAAALVLVPALWRVTRLAVTLVHELGHALIGILMGRRFTGFVLRADMSGHAVTHGRPRGFGLVATTWAGYPAPAVLGTVLVLGATRGWSAPILTAVLVVLAVSWIRVRSVLTGVVMLAVTAGSVALWWWRDDVLQAQVLIGVALVLLIGAWRHLGAVWGGRDRGSDPAVLARLTPLPRIVWLLSFAVVLLGASAAVYLEAVRLL